MKQMGTVLAILLLAACSSGDIVNGSLVGNFGGQTAAVTANHSTAAFDFACGPSLQLGHPLSVDASGRFTVSGTLRNYETPRDTLGPHDISVVVSGQVFGDSVDFNVSSPGYANGLNGHYGARLGVPYTGGTTICRA